MRYWPGLVLGGVAVASWAAVITVDAMNVEGHVEHDLVIAAGVAAGIAGAWLVIGVPILQAIDRAARANRELARAVTLLQLDLEATGPHRALLRAVSPNGHGQHARQK